MVDETQIKSMGFTVAELIVAMSISAITLLTGYELFQALKGAGDTQSQSLAVAAEIVYGLDRIREDLLHALPQTGSNEPVFVGGNPALDGSAETTRLLEFYSLCSGHGDSRFSGLRQMQRVRYELVQVKDSVFLYRSATPVIGAGQVSGAESREPILDRVEQVTIAFHVGGTLKASFSSDQELPDGVDLMVMAGGRGWPLSLVLPCGSSEARL